MPFLNVAQAATFTVNTTSDFVDVNPGDGVCMNRSGRCSLRAAVQEANALPGTDSIVIPAGIFDLTNAGRHEDAAASGDLDLTDDVIIHGAGAGSTKIGGYNADRVFDVHESAHVTLSEVTISGGLSDAAEDDFDPLLGSLQDGGGMLNTGSVTLSNVTFRANRAGPGSSGGGLANLGYATLSHVTFIRNAAGDADIPSYIDGGWGGGLTNSGTIDLTDVTFLANRAGNARPDFDGLAPGSGGGMVNGGIATLTGVTFRRNRSGNGGRTYDGPGVFGGDGGGMVTADAYECGSITLQTVIFQANRAGNGGSSRRDEGGDGGNGGGLADFCGNTTLTDVRFTRNRAGTGGSGAQGGGYGGGGGGMFGYGSSTLNNVTFDGNQAGNGGNGDVLSGGYGGYGGDGGALSCDDARLTNVTIVSNRAGNGTGLQSYGGFGGGIQGGGTLVNVTLALNRAGKAGRGGLAGEGDNLDYGGQVTNTILAGPGQNCSQESDLGLLGHNLDSGNTCGLTAPTDLTNADAHLGNLKDNGGFTPTIALLSQSPAIDAGDTSACPATDQRGVARPQGAACDIGAYEAP